MRRLKDYPCGCRVAVRDGCYPLTAFNRTGHLLGAATAHLTQLLRECAAEWGIA